VSALQQQRTNFEERIAALRDKVHLHQEEIIRLEGDLQNVDHELDDFQDERKKFQLVSDICRNLDELNELGASDLFWDGIATEEQVKGYLQNLREKADFFERRIKKVTDKHEAILEQIKEKNTTVNFLLEDIEELLEQEEQSKYEYVVTREVREIPYRVMVMPWTKKGEDEKKARNFVIIALLLSLLFGALIPMITIPIQDKKNIKVPERLAKFIKKPKPKPQPKQQPKPEKIEELKKKPTEKDRKDARKKVENKGVLAFKNNLADLLDDMNDVKLGAEASLNTSGATARQQSRNILTSQAASGSGGIKSSSLSRSVAGAGDKLSAVAFSRVESAIGTAAAEDRPLSDGPGPARTDEEIQIVFDRYKAALYRIYNRELRSNPTLQGKVVLRITIAPDGSVTKCKVETTDMDSKKLLDKIVERVKKFNFGAKDGVPTITILYPIDFLPAS